MIVTVYTAFNELPVNEYWGFIIVATITKLCLSVIIILFFMSFMIMSLCDYFIEQFIVTPFLVIVGKVHGWSQQVLKRVVFI